MPNAKTLTITFSERVDIEYAEKLRAVLRNLNGVVDVRLTEANSDDNYALYNAKHELRLKMRNILSSDD